MQSYLVSVGVDGTCLRNGNDDDCRTENLGGVLSLTSWGHQLGDILYAIKPGRSILVLNGYIAEAKRLGHFESQHEATGNLLRLIDEDASVDQIKKIVRCIYGSFSIFYFSVELEKAFCVTDRIATRPIWVSAHREGYLVSSQVGPIVNKVGAKDIDLGALGSYLLYGSPIEPTKSIFTKVRAIREGTIEILPLARKPTSHEWYSFSHEPDVKMSYREWVELASNRVQKAAHRISSTTKEPLVFLSGGVDSRLTASALRSVGVKPLLITLGDSENLEIKVAKKVAAALGCPHRSILRDRHWYLRSLGDAAFNSAGSYVWKHAHFAQAFLECQRKYETDAAFLGDFCEAFSKLCCVVDKTTQRVWNPEEFYHAFDQLPLTLYQPANRVRTLSLVSHKVRTDIEEQLREDIIQRYISYKDRSEDPRIVADLFLRWGNASTIATFFMFLDVRSVGPERSIMFDKDVHQLIEILPSRMRDRAHFGSNIVRKLWAKAGNVVDSNTLLPLRFPQFGHSLATKIRPIAGKVRRYFIEDSYRTTASWPKKTLLYCGDSEWKSFFEDRLSNELIYSMELFDRDAIRKSWNEFCRGDLTWADDLEKLVGLSQLLDNVNRPE